MVCLKRETELYVHIAAVVSETALLDEFFTWLEDAGWHGENYSVLDDLFREVAEVKFDLYKRQCNREGYGI